MRTSETDRDARHRQPANLQGKTVFRPVLGLAATRQAEPLFKFVPDEFVVTLPKHNFAGSEIGRALARFVRADAREGFGQSHPGAQGAEHPGQ